MTTRTARRASIHALMLSSAAICLGWPGGAFAQTPQPDEQNQSDIVVTAQKREERLQDVPAAVTALNTTKLATSGQTRLRDYFDTVPGFQVAPSPGGGNQQSLTIRGVSSGAFANPTVGIMIDEVPFGAVTYDFSPEVDPSDLARIEVLRGPQGTLYGASSMGGLVKFVTLDPSTKEFSGKVEAGLTAVSHGEDVGYSVRGSLNLPLSDTIAVRMSAFNREDPGYIDNVATNKRDVNVNRASGVRVSALWNATENVSVKLSGLFQHTKAIGSSEEVRAAGLSDYQQNYMLNTGQSSKTIQAYSAIVHANLGAVDLTSVTGYAKYENYNTQDYSSISPWGTRAQTFFGVPGARSEIQGNLKRLTQEVRATFKTGDMLEWLVGGFYSDEDTPIKQRISGENPTTGAIVGDIITFDIPFKNKEYALFVDPTVHLGERFSIQLGARYSWINSNFLPVTEGGALFPTPLVLPEIVQRAKVFTYLVTPQFKISPDLMIYGRVATGYRPGRSNSFNPLAPGAANADETTNYEVGVKGDLFSRMLTFDLSLYYIDWKNIQITLISAGNGLAYTANAGAAKSEGFEVSATLRPGNGFSFSGWLSYNNAVVTDGVVNAATYAPAGARLPFSAPLTANFSADKTFPISSDLTGSIGMTYTHTDERQGTFIGTPARTVFPAFDKVDLRAGVTSGSWDFNVYVRNVSDVHGMLGGGAGSFPATAFSFVQPRTFGASISKKF